jgi:peroxiredoxin
MTDRPGPSVCQLLGDLHAYRVQRMPPADLQVNIDQRQLLEDTADRAAFVTAGDVVEPFALPERFGFGFPVVSDTGNGLARRFGITFTSSPAAQAQARTHGSDLGEVLGTGRWELPMPTIVVIGQDRVVRFADVHPDWLVRTEAETVIEAVRPLVAVPA